MKNCFFILIYLVMGVTILEAKNTSNLGNLADIAISEIDSNEIQPATAYNYLEDEFLVVWSDMRLHHADIFGRILSGNGTPRTPVFPVFTGGSSEMYPDVAYNRIDNEYMVVWTDWRREEDGSPDIYGIRLDKDGKNLWSPRSESDTSFVICDQDSDQYTPKISHNYINNCYLVVWGDNRHNFRYGYEDLDIWAQRLAANADLLPPLATPSTKENFQIGYDWDYRDIHPDVAYHAGLGDTLNEWLVVFQRLHDKEMYTPSRIWACRVKGENGLLVNTWGWEVQPPNAVSKSLAMGGPPWFPDFTVSWDFNSIWPDMDGSSHGWSNDHHTENDSESSIDTDFIDGSPHVWSNDYWTEDGSATSISGDNQFDYPVPEFMVCWSSDRMGYPDWNVYVQRIAYFPDSDALEMGLITQSQFEGAWISVPLDTNGNPDPTGWWFSWPNYAATTNLEYQSWNDLNYNHNRGEFLVVWNDWRIMGYGSWPPNQADIYGQHLYIDPQDSSLIWTDELGNPGHNPAINTVIVNTALDEGNENYPCIAYSPVENLFLVGYEYDIDPSVYMYQGIHGTMHTGVSLTSVPDKVDIPSNILSALNYPNPFNPETTIEFVLPLTGKVKVTIYDLLGREVTKLFEGIKQAGRHQINWSGEDQRGKLVGSGIYFYRIETQKNTITQKMILMR